MYFLAICFFPAPKVFEITDLEPDIGPQSGGNNLAFKFLKALDMKCL